jgi:hypothetical protein
MPSPAPQGLDLRALQSLGNTSSTVPLTNTTLPLKYVRWGVGQGEAKGLNYLRANLPLAADSLNGRSQFDRAYLMLQQLVKE